MSNDYTEYADLAQWAVDNQTEAMPSEVEGVQHVLHGVNSRITTIDDEAKMDNPRRHRATRKFSDLDSLIAYAKQHGGTSGLGDIVSVWVGTSQVKLVLNDHSLAVPGWQDHYGLMSLGITPLWEELRAIDRKQVTQTQFAEMCETLASGWVDPDQATMLEIAQTIEIAGDREYKSSMRLQNGSQALTYVDNAAARGGAAGDLVVPTRVTMRAQIYQGIPHTAEITARLRTRMVQGSGVRFQLIFDKTATEIELEAREGIRAAIAAQLPDIGGVYLGLDS